jgi:hypothetical protein
LTAGNDLKFVQALLGHASIVLTADTYTSVLDEHAHRGARATAELILVTEKRLARRLRKPAQRRHRDTTRTRGARQVTARARRRKAAGHRGAGFRDEIRQLSTTMRLLARAGASEDFGGKPRSARVCRRGPRFR